MHSVPDSWRSLSPEEIHKRFGKTTWTEAPLGWRYRDSRHFVVLQDAQEGEEIWWSLFRAESGEYVELARNYGEEIWDGDDEDIEIRWDGEFPLEWVEEFVEGSTEWIRLSTSETLETFGPTLETEQPQSWRHREGEHFLVLIGEGMEDGREEFSWSVVREGPEGYEEIAEFFHDAGGGGADEDDDEEDHDNELTRDDDDEIAAPQALPIEETPAPEPEPQALADDWWEVPPFEWAAEIVTADIQARDS
jgi:hypothetical protein